MNSEVSITFLQTGPWQTILKIFGLKFHPKDWWSKAVDSFKGY